MLGYHDIQRRPAKEGSYYVPNPETELAFEKRYAKRAAIDLTYAETFPEIIEKIDNAKSVIEVSRIMATYRKKFFGD